MFGRSPPPRFRRRLSVIVRRLCLLRAHPCVQLLQQRVPLHHCMVELLDHGNAKAAVRNECAKSGPESLRDLLKCPCLFVELSYCLLQALHLRSPYSKNDQE